MAQQQVRRRRNKREQEALYVLEDAILAARHRGEPVGRSRAVSHAAVELIAALDEELEGATA